MTRSLLRFALLASCLPAVGGCFLLGKPDKANIDLRKKNQELEAQVADLQRKSGGDAATIDSLQNRVGTLPTLPRERLDRLFTTHDLKLGKLTGAADLDAAKPGHEGLKVYATPIDQAGDPIKAAGTFTVEAFDLSRDERPKIGTWTFDLDATRQAWTSVLNRYEYVLTLPWQPTPPGGESLHVEVTFVDELTQAQFKKSLDVTLQPRR
jgi:hypothetical protein